MDQSNFTIQLANSLMPRSLSQTLGFYECPEKTSILATVQDDYDFADEWNEQEKFQCRNSCPDKRSLFSTSRWKCRLKSLSFTRSKGSALSKQFTVGDSTRQAISHLRHSMIDISSHTLGLLKDSMPVRHRYSEADISRYGDIMDQFRSETPPGKDFYEESINKEAQETFHTQVADPIVNLRESLCCHNMKENK
ncbi:hypothetical protein CCR75_002856 [Bremia lactucae]|uniref:Uncharacterized protein n=1 Tax=Bremia lactucae TaxID=4779 RepID=A0A976FMA0_BRELC|nr:hypothetical protein CCR75_002856 [Bremia lactucae]